MEEILEEYLRTPTPETPSPLMFSTPGQSTVSTLVETPLVPTLTNAQVRLITTTSTPPRQSFELEPFLDSYRKEVGNLGFEAFVAGSVRMELARMGLLKKRSERKKSWGNLSVYIKKLME